MILVKEGGLKRLEFSLLNQIPGLVHGVFLRQGGVSQGSFSSLNTGEGIGDDPLCVAENRKRILGALRVKTGLWGSQVHGKRVVNVQSSQDPGECDALITNMCGISLVVNHADCQATIFYDPIHKAIGIAHSGWKGNVLNIYLEVVKEMEKAFGTKGKDLLACVSPSLGPDHAEFIHYKTEFPSEFFSFQIKKNHFDLWALAKAQLESAGIKPCHIQLARICTYDHGEDFFSYRRDKVTGRNATAVSLVRS